jgi:lipopolysaccharide transport system permease protein
MTPAACAWRRTIRSNVLTLSRLADMQGHRLVVGEMARLFSRYGNLTYELTKREISERFAGQAIGALWAIGHPVMLMAVYVFVFSYVFRARFGETVELPRNYVVFLLSGLTCWLAFQEALAKAPTVILASRNLVKQIVFPIEVLPVKSALATLPGIVIGVGFTAAYSLAYASVPLTILLLPPLVAAQLMAMAGLTYLLSAIGVYLRDLKDFVIALLAIGVFVHPIIFVPNAIPAWLEYLFYLSPISYFVWAYQDAMFYGHIAHPWAWIAVFAGSPLLWYAGYRTFRALRIYFGNAI